MARLIFNPNAAKYKCCLEMFHARSVAAVVCFIAVLWHVLSYYDTFFAKKSPGSIVLRALSITLPAIFFIDAFSGIICAKPHRMQLAIWYMRLRIATYLVLNLILLGAYLPSSSVQMFSLYFCKQMFLNTGLTENEETQKIGAYLVYFGGVWMVFYWVHDVLNKCYKYFNDKAAFDELAQNKSVLPQVNDPSAHASPPPAYNAQV